jgi:DNA-binding response OmpR family regulator
MERHVIQIVEDDPATARALEEIVRSMDFDCRVATTLEEAKASFAESMPCALLQDMELPHALGAQPHAMAGESSIRAVRSRSRGPMRVPILVVTALAAEVDFVWRMAELEADAFIPKSNVRVLPEKLLGYLKKNGREDHARCAQRNAQSRPGGERVQGLESAQAPALLAAHPVAPDPAATLYANDRHGVPILTTEFQSLVERRRDFDLFLDYATDDPRGRLAGYRDHAGVFHESFLGETSAWIVSELVRVRKPVRADALKRLRGGGSESAVRLVQKARKAVDVHLLVRGKESRTEWRSLHTFGEKDAIGFEFRPPAGMTWVVMVRERG